MVLVSASLGYSFNQYYIVIAQTDKVYKDWAINENKWYEHVQLLHSVDPAVYSTGRCTYIIRHLRN